MRTPYQKAFDHVTASERLKEEVLDMTRHEKQTLCRRIPKFTLIAAIIALLLAGTALAVNIPQLQDWFRQYWEDATGADALAPQQEDLLNGLTQSMDTAAEMEPTAQPDTGGHAPAASPETAVTVSLDSVAAGENSLWMLIHVTGSYEPGTMYTFEKTILNGAPEKTFSDLGIAVGGGIKYERSGSQILSDGSLQIMIRYQSPDPAADLTQGGTYQLHLENLMMESELVQEGQWDLSFTLDETTALPTVELEHIILPVSGLEGVDSVDFEEVCVTSTGVKLVCQPSCAGYSLWTDVALILADGTEIPCDGARANWEGEPDVSRWIANYSWKVPVSLDQAAALRFDDTVVALP